MSKIEFADIFGTAIGPGSKTRRGVRRFPIMPLLMPWVLKWCFTVLELDTRFLLLTVFTDISLLASPFTRTWTYGQDRMELGNTTATCLPSRFFLRKDLSLQIPPCRRPLLHDTGDSLWVNAHIPMLPMLQHQISDISYGPWPLVCARTKHHRGLRTKHNQDTCLLSMLGICLM